MTRNPAKLRTRFVAMTLGAACAASLSLGLPPSARADRTATAPAGERGRPREGDGSERTGGFRRDEHDRRGPRDGEGRPGDDKRPDEKRFDDKRPGDKRTEGDKDGKWDRDRKGSREVSEEEWRDLTAFMTEHSVNKWKMFQSIPEHHSIKGRAKAGIVHRYRELRSLESGDSERYAIELRRVRVEDELFGILGKIKEAGDKLSDEQQQEMLLPKVQELWKVRTEDRELQGARIMRQLRDLRLNNSADALAAELEEERSPEKQRQWVERWIEMSRGRMNYRRGRGE